MVKQAFKKITNLLGQGQSVERITFSFCLGIFVACSPFIGFHTALLFVLSWLLQCNPVVVFTTVYLVSNPITMVPLLALDYIFGEWLFKTVLNIDLLKYNPSWMVWFNSKIGHYLSDYLGITELSFWSFILGGTILALIIALVAYPCIKPIFNYIAQKKNDYENNNAK